MECVRCERSQMTIRPLAAALLALSALALAACGEETPSAAGGAEAREEARQAELKFASCMRKEGIDMPDPTADGERQFRIGGDSGISPEEFERAAEACEKYRKDIRPELTEEEQQEFKENALAHARCMREQGIDFPDPTFDAEGGATIRMQAGKGKINPEDPEFQAAEEKCGRLMERPGTEEQP
jgi:predicted aconitase